MILFDKSATFWFASRYRVFADPERRRGDSQVRFGMQTATAFVLAPASV